MKWAWDEVGVGWSGRGDEVGVGWSGHGDVWAMRWNGRGMKWALGYLVSEMSGAGDEKGEIEDEMEKMKWSEMKWKRWNGGDELTVNPLRHYINKVEHINHKPASEKF